MNCPSRPPTWTIRTARTAGTAAAIVALLHGTAAGQSFLYRSPSPARNTQYGLSVANLAGSLDDGIVIGGPGRRVAGQPDTGMVEVRNARTNVLLYTLLGGGGGDRYGVRVAVGDLDGDAINELLIGADQTVSVGVGYVDVLDAPTGSFLTRFKGPKPGCAFGGGGILILPGDFDGDGRRDLAIGAPNEDTTLASAAGAVHIVSSATGADIALLEGSSKLARFGHVLTLTTDLDGDGLADLAVGAPGDAGTGSVTLYGSATWTPLWPSSGFTVNEEFGSAVTVIHHDFDGDGIDDLAVGSPAVADPSLPGRIYVLSTKTGVALLKAEQGEAGDELGIHIALGDVNGDTVEELIVGAPGTDGSGTDRGRVVAFEAASLAPVTQLDGAADKDGFGACSAVADLGPSGADGVAVGAPFSDAGFIEGGAVEVWSLEPCPASALNYGAGWPGTLGIPSLDCTPAPALGASVSITVGNSSPGATFGLLLVGFSKVSVPTTKDGTLLVGPPWIALVLSLPAGALVLSGTLPINTALCGLEVDLQCLELDLGASKGMSFTPGLELLLGGT